MSDPGPFDWRRLRGDLDASQRVEVRRLAMTARAAADPWIASCVVAYVRSRLWFVTHVGFVASATGVVVIAALLAAGGNAGWAFAIFPLAAPAIRWFMQSATLRRAEELNLQVMTRWDEP